VLIICAIGQRGGAELVQRMAEVVGVEAECLLLHVIDAGPRHDIEEYLYGPLHRLPHSGKPMRAAALKNADEASGHTAVEEGLNVARRAGLKAEASIQEGRPGEKIVQLAAATKAALIVIAANEGAAGHPRLGPASLGHTARFVIDHAPCDVLLVRQAVA
jgi:nucleotide-binding universal stress UspA family protein